MNLKGYQLVGVNYLLLLYRQHVGGGERGWGKQGDSDRELVVGFHVAHPVLHSVHHSLKEDLPYRQSPPVSSCSMSHVGCSV